MGFFDKLKNFGSKVIKGVRKGYDFVKDKIAPVVRKVLPIVQTAGSAAATALGRPDIGMGISKGAAIVDKGLKFMGR